MVALFDQAKSSGVTKPVDLTPAPFKGLQGPLADALKAYFGQSGTGAPNLGDTSGLSAGVTPDQTALLQQMMAQLSQSSGQNPLTQAAGENLTALASGGPNPFLEAMVQSARQNLTRSFEGSIVPQLLSRFTARGQQVQGDGSSAFAHEAGLASNDFLNALSGVETNLRGQAYEGDQSRRLQAAQAQGQLGTQIGADDFNRLKTTFDSAALPQLVKDLGIQRGLEAYNTKMQTIMQALQLAAGVSQPTIANAGYQKSKSEGGVLNTVAQFF